MHENPILLVDDDPDFCNLIKNYLRDEHVRIDVCGDIESAKGRLNENKYDVLLLDINLNGQNGGEILKYLRNSDSHLNRDVPSIIVSSHLTPEFISKNRQKCADFLAKPFSDCDIIQALKRILIDPEDVSLDSVRPEASGPALFEGVSYKEPFEIPPDLKNVVVNVLDQLQHHPGLKKLFDTLKVNRSLDSYYNEHIGLLLNIATGIAVQNEWSYGSYLEKLAYAAYLHDLYLIDKPHLAKISTKVQLEQQKANLKFREDRIVIEHPELMAIQLEKVQVIPADAITIIRQHHELPDGSGFPNGIHFKRFHPMSILFIVAHDLTDYIIDNPKWDLKLYCQNATTRFQGTQFLKMITSLSQCK
ncbi:MAG: response regulator [Bdellovibrio sp.]|nr:response regulator [Bdellovibrio sp.]